jgi:ABC-type uncharacterized transport system substrate-binding protein
MVPNAADADFVANPKKHGWRASGVAADVSPRQQVDWIKRLQPGCRKLAVLHSSATRRTTESLREASGLRGIKLISIDARMDEFAEALDALGRSGCDAVLMLPDPRIYNTPNVKELILWGLRERKPVWTFSNNIVKAGAFAGQSVSPEEVGRKAAKLVAKLLDGDRTSRIGLQYAAETEKAVNLHTAERLEMTVGGRLGSDVTTHGASR